MRSRFLLYFETKDAPQEAVTPSSTTIIEGNDVILFCNATGNPEPNVTWTRAGDNITLSASEILRLKNLTRLDNGAVYKCSLMNYIGSAEASAVITVYCKFTATLYAMLSISFVEVHTDDSTIHEYDYMNSASQVRQRPWVRIPHKPEIFQAFFYRYCFSNVHNCDVQIFIGFHCFIKLAHPTCILLNIAVFLTFCSRVACFPLIQILP